VAASVPLLASVLYAEGSVHLQRLEMQQKAQNNGLHVTMGPVQLHEPRSASIVLTCQKPKHEEECIYTEGVVPGCSYQSGILTSEVKVPKGAGERQPLHLRPIMRVCGEVGHPFLPVQLLLCQSGSPTLLLQVGLVVLCHHHRLHLPTRHAPAMCTHAEPEKTQI